MTEQRSTLPKDPQELDHTGTYDDLLAEVAMAFPLAGYTAAAKATDDDEAAFNHQILAGLVSP